MTRESSMDEANAGEAVDGMAGLPAVWDGPTAPDDASTMEKIQRADEAREGFAGEHWLVLAVGIGLWQVTRRHRWWAVRTLGSIGASMLVARAASGRDGLAKVLRYTPFGGRIVIERPRSPAP
jgi:hypothetical protein